MSDIRTSASHPIYAAWLPSHHPGKMGLTIAPGKHQLGMLTHIDWRRDLGADLDTLRHDPEQHCDALVCLLEEHELTSLKIPDYRAEVSKRGFDLLELAIPDGMVPDDQERVDELVLAIDARMRAGQRIVIHCAGGLGRSGTVAGCVMVHQGSTPEEALAALVKHRSPRCPENSTQRNYIQGYAARPSRASRFRGAVIGAAIGDAMGHPTEFLDMAGIHRAYGPQGVQGFELWWERDGQRFAPYTDDTQMAEVVLQAVVEEQEQASGPGDPELDATMKRMAAGFITWSHEPQGGHRAPGNACLRGCAALERGVPWQQAGGSKDGGCGSVMRAYPFALAFGDDEARAERFAVEHSKLTHGDPIALAACAAMTRGLVRIQRAEPPAAVCETMIAAAQEHSPPTGQMMRQAYDEALAGVGPEHTLDRLRAWAAHEAIAAAVYLFARHPDDPRAAIVEGANTPGDSDSLATLAGALGGARCGVAALPGDWIRGVERSAELSTLALRLDAALARRAP